MVYDGMILKNNGSDDSIDDDHDDDGIDDADIDDDGIDDDDDHNNDYVINDDIMMLLMMLYVPVNPWYLSGSGSNDFVNMFHSLTYTDSSPYGIEHCILYDRSMIYDLPFIHLSI